MILRRLGILAVIYIAVAVTLVIMGSQYQTELHASLWVKTTTGGELEIFRGEGPFGDIAYTPLAENVVAYAKVDKPEQLVVAEHRDGTASLMQRSGETRWAAEQFDSVASAIDSVRGLREEQFENAWRKRRLFGGGGGSATLLVLATAVAGFFALQIIKAGRRAKTA
jgi:hypothetical protein